MPQFHCPEFSQEHRSSPVPSNSREPDVDIRSDLYSLGVTLWKMLMGKTPFRGSSADAMYQHQRVPLPVEQLGGVPQPLVVLLEVLLEKDPARRFQSPAELLEGDADGKGSYRREESSHEDHPGFRLLHGRCPKGADSGGSGDSLGCW